MKTILSAILLSISIYFTKPYKIILFNNKQVISSQKITFDSITSTAPIKIGNNLGIINIKGERIYQHKKIIDSNFLITITDIPDFSFSKQIDKRILIDENQFIIFKDSTNRDYLENAVIKKIEFDFIRSKTLNFKATLENPEKNKLIIGRFNIFYLASKKRNVFGWITREIKTIS
ncbi:hypothetical protein [Tenacibaculum sp. M341]|uniref:hypothetical protein n=1 Tax=Tenacibaculum sp. M341 TaxID=2530339 RepID=UPI001045D4DA|nr:hypothetical protein [Tenacibaculum sp. M341]TCI85451.1 hypothetical protein EYW44_17020 [Tenacibaculum sp. M341]